VINLLIELNSGVNRLKVVRQIQALPGYRIHQIVGVYVSLLGVAPTPDQVQQALGFLAHGGSIRRLGLRLLESDAYFLHHGGTAAGFLNALGQDVLHHALGPSLQASLAEMLARGASRDAVIKKLLEDKEVPVAGVQGLYLALLHRAATQAEVTKQLTALKHGKTADEIIAELVASDEYFRRASGT
jgi:hypothetical protein